MVKFVKYLGDFGWSPVVVTRRPTRFEVQDSSLLEDVPANCQVHWTDSWDPAAIVAQLLPARTRRGPHQHAVRGGVTGRHLGKVVWDVLRDWLLSPHPFWLWLPCAYGVASKVISAGGVDVVLADSRLASVLALVLHERFGVPYVVDYRNAWVGDPHLRLPTPLHRGWNRFLEGRILSKAAAAVFLDPSALNFALSSYPVLSADRSFLISNGFDRSDFPESLALPRSGPFTLGYVGSLYGHYGYSLAVVCQALRRLREKSPTLEVRFLIVGRVSPEMTGVLEQYGLLDVTTMTGYVAHKKAIRYLLESHVLLLLLDRTEDGRAVSIPGKLYEYMAARRKVLYVGPPCSTSSLLRDCGLGVWSDMDPDCVISALTEWKAQYEAGELSLEDAGSAAQWERRTLTGKLAGVLDLAAARGRSSAASVHDRGAGPTSREEPVSPLTPRFPR